jgi:cytochrome c oxidase assembly factor CtaG
VAVTLILTALAAALYAQAFVRLRTRAGPARARAWQPIAFGAGLAVSALAVLVVPEDELLAAHMLQHLLLGDVGPLLLVLGLAGPLGLFVVPRAALRVIGRGLVRLLDSARAAVALWLATLAVWHVPALYDAAETHPALHVAEHVCFATAGLLVWHQILSGRLSAGRRALIAFVLLVASAVLAEVLVATPPLYPLYSELSDRPFGWTAGQDQSRAALLMMAEQFATFGTALTFLMRAHVERVAAELPGGP